MLIYLGGGFKSVPGLTEKLSEYLQMIQDKGMIESVKSIL